MSSTASVALEERLLACRHRLAMSPELWHSDLMDPERFRHYISKKGTRIFGSDTIIKLWQIGLLRADLITSEKPIKNLPLQPVNIGEESLHTYLDNRKIAQKIKGFGGTFPRRSLRRDIKVYFHPFRLYVAYHIERVFRSNFSSTQYLTYPAGYQNLAKRHVEELDRWTSEANFCEHFDKWNKTAEAAITFEPPYYSIVFSRTRWRSLDSREAIDEKRKAYKEEVLAFSRLASDHLEQFRLDLCKSAQLLDDNKALHVLLRLTTWHKRDSISSNLGGCMLYLSMAEMIRRALEEALDQEFPEEDELGFGQWMPGARKMLYGSERVLDAPRTHLRDFLSEIGMDNYSVKTRCYIEGDTEHGALAAALGNISGIQLINLRGQVAERRGRGLAFRDNLEADLKSHVFSFVMLDSDNHEYVRAARRAAQDDLISGGMFICKPDFEFANFTIDELCCAFYNLLRSSGADAGSSAELAAATRGACSGKSFFAAIAKVFPHLHATGKSEAWGEALMELALKARCLPDGTERPLIRDLRIIINASQVKYSRSREKYKVDPITGELTKRIRSELHRS